MRFRYENMSAGKIILIAAFAFFAAIGPAMGRYEIISHTIDGGGGTSRSDRFVVSGSIGQPDADGARSETFELLGGFWPGGPLCVVQFDDFARLAAMWLDTGPGLAGDLDDDEDVDFADVKTFAELWLYYCPYAWPLK